eukprot:TRINITY_DN1352_c2_g1_i1.p1 TRINITY_DN1352_c2_g1~~TRINITY_DN1352_c2_g1_i1.p1  ORF type:complete len:768 (+),score=212.89 TRINITY_DN1352_c2_g1_i1:180-2306(+)
MNPNAISHAPASPPVPSSRGRSYSCSSSPASRYDDDFVELEELGYGGFGRVYKVENKLDGLVYALKKIPFRHTNRDLVEKVLREVKTLALLHHPNVVRYHSAWLELDSARIMPGWDQATDPNGNSITATTSNNNNNNNNTNNTTTTRPKGSKQQRDECDDFSLDDIQTIGSMQFASLHNLTSPRAHIHVDFSSSSASSDYTDDSSEMSEDLSALVNGDDDESATGTDDYSEDRSGPFPDLSQSPYPAAGGEWPPSRGVPTTLFITMQLCTFNLARWLETRRRINPDQNLHIFKQILQGLKYIHSRGVVHRDLKPSNVFLTAMEEKDIASISLSLRKSAEDIRLKSPIMQAVASPSSRPLKLADMAHKKDKRNLDEEDDEEDEEDEENEQEEFLVSLGDFGMATLNPDTPPSTPTRSPRASPFHLANQYYLSSSSPSPSTSPCVSLSSSYSSSSFLAPVPGSVFAFSPGSSPTPMSIVPSRTPSPTSSSFSSSFGSVSPMHIATPTPISLRASHPGLPTPVADLHLHHHHPNSIVAPIAISASSSVSPVSSAKPPRSSSCVGTPTYSAPEQRNGNRPSTSASDMYSLGIILFELYSTFSTKMERAHVLTQLKNGILPPAFMATYPRESALISWLMHPEPQGRPCAETVLAFDLFQDSYVCLPRSRVVELEDRVRDQENIMQQQRDELATLKAQLAQYQQQQQQQQQAIL